MYRIRMHKSAEKRLAQCPKRIRDKAYIAIKHLRHNGTLNLPFTIKPLQGPLKRRKFLEAKIDKDYRIIFRRNEDGFFIRSAGAHNQLHTG